VRRSINTSWESALEVPFQRFRGPSLSESLDSTLTTRRLVALTFTFPEFDVGV
jgi:hypothetical protein